MLLSPLFLPFFFGGLELCNLILVAQILAGACGVPSPLALKLATNVYIICHIYTDQYLVRPTESREHHTPYYLLLIWFSGEVYISQTKTYKKPYET